eukprot:snap_masked-scaffold_1-processed-gene-21.34-mRNA-1 protein AED:1.00 eAED:1.00 QI:0/0/0/0/1/1/2/0/107
MFKEPLFQSRLEYPSLKRTGSLIRIIFLTFSGEAANTVGVTSNDTASIPEGVEPDGVTHCERETEKKPCDWACCFEGEERMCSENIVLGITRDGAVYYTCKDCDDCE